MTNNISVWGIETNNLKNIDISLKKNSINLIIGPSGSGKSSLAYDTIAQIGQHEFLSMFANEVSEPTYKVKGYSGMVAAIPINQINNNNNIRSTIGTYFGLNRSINLVFSAMCGVPEDFFVLNKKVNLCEKCNGIGYVKELDANKIVNYTVPLKDNPVRCWDKYKEFYRKIIVEYCSDVGIDPNKSFRQLDDHEKELFLYGESQKKYKILYKKVNANSSRTTKYYGVMLNQPLVLGASISDKYFSDVVCPCCNGKKYSKEHDDIKAMGLSIGDYMLTPFSRLKKYNNDLRKKCGDSSLDFAFDKIDAFLNKAVELNLGHLFFHRSIPTLSGGEFQRLRMVQVLNTQLSDLLIVLDEPLGGLSGNEKKMVYENILELSKNNTLVIVDHGNTFVKSAKVLLALGEKSGKDGGKIIDANKYLAKQSNKPALSSRTLGNDISVNIGSKMYQYNGANILLAENSLNLITGASGIGKSTLIREYFPQLFDKYLYISQKPIVGNKNSNVATVLDVAIPIYNAFAKKHKKGKDFFSNHTGDAGCCPICMGAGYVEFGNERDSLIRLECSDCSGTGFNKNLKKYKLNDKSIFDIWGMTVDEAIPFFTEIDSKISLKLQETSNILLGHLLIGQPTSTLSGGENIRIKLLKSSTSKAKLLGVDEPFKGLSNSEIFSVIKFLMQLCDKEKTVVVVDHNEQSFNYFQRRILLTVKKDILTGVEM